MTNNNQMYFHHLNLKKTNKMSNVITLDHAIHIILFQIVYKLPPKKKILRNQCIAKVYYVCFLVLI